ncbi:MAG: hypothetical protein ACLGIR_04635 [Actinomycetes bacterium]
MRTDANGRALLWVALGLVLFGVLVGLLSPGTFRLDAFLVIAPLGFLGLAVLAMIGRAGGQDPDDDPASPSDREPLE